jgi:protein disulfide-isomerase
MRMEQEVFSKASVAAALTAHYVPVKIDPDKLPHLAHQFGVTHLPTDVVITPNGQEVDRLIGALPLNSYLSRRAQVAANARGQAPTAANVRGTTPLGNSWMTEDLSPGDSVPLASAVSSRQSYLTPPPPAEYHAAARQADPPAAGFARPVGPSAGAAGAAPSAAGVPASGASPASMARQARAPAAEPALDGYCSVQLVDKNRWVKGDRRYGVIHRGRTYLFSGPAEANQFYANPDHYAPVLSGNDIVLAVDHGLTVPGTREVGARYGDHIFLFAGEASYEKFSQDPDKYTTAIERLLSTARHPGRTRNGAGDPSSQPGVPEAPLR